MKKMSEIWKLPWRVEQFTLHNIVSWAIRDDRNWLVANYLTQDSAEAICRAVNEYDALQAMVRELSDTLALEVSPQNDEVLCARKLLGDES